MKTIRKTNERKISRKATERTGKQKAELWPWALALAVALFAAFQVYAPALHGPFLFDDSYLPMNVPAWSNGSFLDSLRAVRPLLMASYWLNQHLSGADTTQYHEWNVIFHF